MPTVDSYAQGTPCWVDLSSTDVDGARAFYAGIFGWEYAANVMSPEMTYYLATKNSGNVAGLSQQMPEMAASGIPSNWTTYLAVDNVDEAAARVTEAGGSLMFPPDEVPGNGRMVIATDSSGTPVGLWEAKGMIGSSVVNEPGAVIWNELQVDDVAAVLPFYRSVAGLEAETGPAGDMSDYTQLMVSGRSVGGALAKPMPEMPNNWTVYFNVADVDVTAAKIAELGGHVIAPPFDVSTIGRMGVFSDPQGAVFALMAGGMGA
ncbi:VOC family protein [Arthrobacter sp. A5]|uniref:VOC family protein n=1 Tax=Arthrobacter sp. A5 TaxID=576926 RepID=UPI003DA9FA93